jgi:hypothetical protein
MMINNPAMKRFLLHSAAAAALTASLAACGGGGGSDGGTTVTPPPAPPTPVRLEDQFGAQFGAMFRAAANTDPRDPAPGDLIPISFTTDPVNIT